MQIWRFMIGEKVLLKVSLIKGVMRFEMNSILNPRFIGLFEVLQRIGEMAYELSIPLDLLNVHTFFYVLILKKYRGDGSLVIKWYSVQLRKNLTFDEEPMAIIDRQVSNVRSKDRASVKVQW
ncbi:uncharacterized protein LOC129894678 [Solanum dulcamara]|uniref:uncharacterized protein LOC129894678 n=1 Tax=Solanum dulcamara TaxID=45834 RepID=UPI0024855870|nr:uncharacterized protein LOC129894678 [Solanum dulcamara]